MVPALSRFSQRRLSGRRWASRRGTRGLTLIELMVALAVLGVVGVLTWRATSHLIDARQRIGDELSRWQAVAHASALIERELLQIAPPELAEGGGSLPTLVLEGRTDGSRSRLGWRVVGGEHAFARIEIRHADGKLEALIWPDRAAQAPPTRLALLDRVTAVRWQVLSAGRRHEQWPPPAGAASRPNAQRPSAAPLPEAVELSLELADVGTITRIFALR